MTIFASFPCLILSTFLSFLSAAHAQEAVVNAPPLTRESIQGLYNEGITSYKKDVMSYKLFLTRTLHDTALIVSESYVTIPGREAVASRDKMKKIDMLDIAEQSFNSMKGVEFTRALSSVDIAADGKTAVVKSATRMKNLNLGGVFGDATGECLDQLVATSVGPQIIMQKCKTDIFVNLP